MHELISRGCAMGIFGCSVRISSLDGPNARDVEATVGTGAPFTTLPARLLRELGIKATGRRGFALAGARRVDMDYGRAWATIDGRSVITIVAFGEDDAPALLGTYTLDGLGLTVNPEHQRLVSTPMILYQCI